MEISVSERPNCTVVTLAGELRIAQLAKAREDMRTIVEQGRQSVIINLRNVGYVDSSGVGLLVAMHHVTKTTNRKLILTEMVPNVYKVFQLTNLFRLFNIAQTESEALEIANPHRVFLFDDREDIVYFYRKVVEAKHIVFSYCDNLNDTFDFLSKNEVSLILLDAKSGEESKYELLRRVKSNVQLAKIPVAIVSVDEDEQFNFVQFGIDHFFLKPFKVEKFIATVREIMATHDNEVTLDG